jgi:hypothetical protein
VWCAVLCCFFFHVVPGLDGRCGGSKAERLFRVTSSKSQSSCQGKPNLQRQCHLPLFPPPTPTTEAFSTWLKKRKKRERQPQSLRRAHGAQHLHRRQRARKCPISQNLEQKSRSSSSRRAKAKQQKRQLTPIHTQH